MLRVTVWGNRLWICLREETLGVAVTSAWAFVGVRMALVQRAQVLQNEVQQSWKSETRNIIVRDLIAL
jgi:hypothetical protein